MNHQTTKTDLDAEYVKLRQNYKTSIRKRSFFIIGGLILFVAMIIVTAISLLTKSDAHEAAENYISANAEVQKATGGIKDFGMLPTGSIHVNNGHGGADLTLSVNGKKHDLDVFVHLEKEPNMEWQVLEMRIEK